MFLSIKDPCMFELLWDDDEVCLLIRAFHETVMTTESSPTLPKNLFSEHLASHFAQLSTKYFGVHYTVAPIEELKDVLERVREACAIISEYEMKHKVAWFQIPWLTRRKYLHRIKKVQSTHLQSKRNFRNANSIT
jgi:hypothetical protein